VSKSDLDEIRDRYDLRDLYPQIKRRSYGGGRYDSDVCVFHGEVHPSMIVGKERYKCQACGEKGDVFNWVMFAESVDFRDALAILKEGKRIAPVTVRREIKHIDPPIFKSEDAEYQSAMGEEEYADLEDVTGITKATAQTHKIGKYGDRIYTIPIYNPLTKLSDIKVYNPYARKDLDERKTWHDKAGAVNTLYGLTYISGSDYVVIVGGEKDTILGHQNNLPFVTVTGGEESWWLEFNQFLHSFRWVYSFLDADPAGRRGTMKIRKLMPRIIPCDWRKLWDGRVAKGFDFADFINTDGSKQDFEKMLELARKNIAKPIRQLRTLMPPPDKMENGMIKTSFEVSL